MTDEEKIAKAKQDAQEAVTKTAQEAAKVTAEEAVKSVNEKLEEIVKKFDGFTTQEAAEQLKGEFKKEVAELQARIKAMRQTKGNEAEKSFNENLKEAIEKSADKLKELATSKGHFSETIVMKAVGDMSIGANFPGATPITQQVQPGMIMTPYNRVWLSDLIPNATAGGSSVLYPKENGGEGAVAFWDKSGEKAQVDYDFTTETAFFKWIAGYVIVERDMLDDISWLTSYLQQKLLIGLKTAENDFILNGTGDTNPVQGLLAAATAYDGDYTNLVDMIIDAAYGQIPEDTHDHYVPSNVILNPRDVVKIGLNKAGGSGEYDLPQGSAVFQNGRLSISGLDTVGTTSMTKDNFLTLSRDAVMFLRRMSPEIRVFEDAELAKVNKVMFRIEARVSQAIFNSAAIVKGTYVEPVPAG